MYSLRWVRWSMQLEIHWMYSISHAEQHQGELLFKRSGAWDEIEIALDQVIFRLPPTGIVGGTVRRV